MWTALDEHRLNQIGFSLREFNRTEIWYKTPPGALFDFSFRSTVMARVVERAESGEDICRRALAAITYYKLTRNAS